MMLPTKKEKSNLLRKSNRIFGIECQLTTQISAIAHDRMHNDFCKLDADVNNAFYALQEAQEKLKLAHELLCRIVSREARDASNCKECPDCGIDIEVDATLLNAYEAGCVYCDECANERLGVEND